MKRRRLLGGDEENDPMSVVGNLFDVAMVFAVALMVALVTRYNMTEMLSPEDSRTPARRTWRSSSSRERTSTATPLPRTSPSPVRKESGSA